MTSLDKYILDRLQKIEADMEADKKKFEELHQLIDSAKREVASTQERYKQNQTRAAELRALVEAAEQVARGIEAATPPPSSAAPKHEDFEEVVVGQVDSNPPTPITMKKPRKKKVADA